MFPVRYELNSYINLLRNSVLKGLRRRDRCTSAGRGYEHSTSLWPTRRKPVRTQSCATHATRSKNVGIGPNA
jgi:hypothetical protein